MGRTSSRLTSEEMDRYGSNEWLLATLDETGREEVHQLITALVRVGQSDGLLSVFRYHAFMDKARDLFIDIARYRAIGFLTMALMYKAHWIIDETAEHIRLVRDADGVVLKDSHEIADE